MEEMKVTVLVKAGSYDTHERIDIKCKTVSTDDSGRLVIKDAEGNLIASFKWDHIHGWYKNTQNV